MKKVTIITVTFNSAATIRETIESVLSQDYPNIEYIIIDGLSVDGTQEIVKSYGSSIAHFISEKDKGLYDAMNKGIEIASGDVIGIINSDDLYAHPKIISNIVSVFEKDNVGIVYGDLIYFKTGMPDVPIRYYKGGVFSTRRVQYGLMPPHPTFFIHKNVYTKYGKFDLQFTLSADFDLILRFLGVHKVQFKYCPEVFVKMRTGGKSTSSLKRTLIMNREDLSSCQKNGIYVNPFKFYLKYPIKFFDFLN
ncbi:glycosyl transferase [Cytophagales bacterium WSM2-2]|nr:glycosyl transferase [Cytophagales bacterium WSM2-2]